MQSILLSAVEPPTDGTNRFLALQLSISAGFIYMLNVYAPTLCSIPEIKQFAVGSRTTNRRHKPLHCPATFHLCRFYYMPSVHAPTLCSTTEIKQFAVGSRTTNRRHKLLPYPETFHLCRFYFHAKCPCPNSLLNSRAFILLVFPNSMSTPFLCESAMFSLEK